MLKSAPPRRAGMFGFVIASGALLLCASSGCSAPPPQADFDSVDPSERARAITAAADTRDARQTPKMIASLESSDPALRMLAIAALEEVHGSRLGYDPVAPLAERTKAVEAWAEWWRGQEMADVAAEPPETPRP